MNKVLEWFNDNTYYSVKSGNVTFDIQNDDYWEFQRLLTNQCAELEEKDKEIEKLNNIIDELEKYLENEIRLEMSLDRDMVLRDVFTKLLELKGSDKK